MKKRKNLIPTRPLTPEEKSFIKRFHNPTDRKEFYFKLMSGEDFEKFKPWAERRIEHYELAVDEWEELLEDITVCEKQKLPDFKVLSKALKVPQLLDSQTIDRQIAILVPLFYTVKTPDYEKEFKNISYHFLDKLAERHNLFTGQMLDYIFAGDYFSVASGVLLAKHHRILSEKSSFCRLHLNTMLMRLAQKEGIISENSEGIALQLFKTSLVRPLNKEEISIMVVYALMQMYPWEMIDSHEPIALLSNYTKDVENAVDFCEINGFSDIKMWEKALQLRGDKFLWNRQVELITRFLLNIKLDEYSNLKAITYRFILESFRHGFISSEIIDFIFDGRLFSNASTVVLALSCNQLREHNLAPYIQEKLSGMLTLLLKQEELDLTLPELAEYLLETSLNREMYKEEISIFNAYVLQKAFQ